MISINVGILSHVTTTTVDGQTHTVSATTLVRNDTGETAHVQSGQLPTGRYDTLDMFSGATDVDTDDINPYDLPVFHGVDIRTADDLWADLTDILAQDGLPAFILDRVRIASAN